MDVLPAALFLIPGAFAAVAHRFASAQRLSSGTQLLLAIGYSGLTYIWLASPLGDALRTAQFPAALFGPNLAPLAQPEIAIRLFAASVVATAAGLLVGRITMSRRAHALVARVTGRNLYSSIWIETFRDAPRQWIRLKTDGLEFVGWLESASDDPQERALLISNIHEMHGAEPHRVVGNMMFVNADAFPVIVLLGAEVATAVDAARRRPALTQA
jgi:hypothetical protein